MRHRVTFRERSEPLAAQAVLAEGESVPAILRQLHLRSDDALSALEGVRAAGALVVIGASDALPWCDGVTYFGPCAEAPQLLLPVLLEPDVPVSWLAAALALEAPSLVVPRPQGLRIVSLACARPLARAYLESA